MDNDLIIQESWLKRNWKWIVPFFAFIALGAFYLISEIKDINKEPEHQTAFDKNKWAAKQDADYVYRNEMLKDLVASNTLKRLKKDEIIELLGAPDRIDSAYLFYRIAQKRIQFFPLHTRTLVIKLSGDGSDNKVMIHQ